MVLQRPTSFPQAPGVYIFRGVGGDILYVGKAKLLASRISAYFSKASELNDKIAALRVEAATVDYIVTFSEEDALFLEEYLIKLYQPRYNILLMEGQPFLYLCITSDSPPDFIITRVTKDKEGTYFGPFMNKKAVRRSYDYLMKRFRLYRCSQRMMNGCLKYHLGSCAGSCKDAFDEDAYRMRMQLVEQLLKGNTEGFKDALTTALATCHAHFDFEQARQLHEYTLHLDELFATIKNNFSPERYHRDIAHVMSSAALLDKKEADIYQRAQQELQELLGVKKPIITIDCFDVSHHQGHHMVGSSIRFRNGMPERSSFRQFRIKTVQGQNDYAALQEIVQRRYKHETDIPDLVLIDGGKGQLSAVKAVVPNVLCASLAKREERLFTEQFPHGVLISVATPAGRLIISLRDYAHHFAVRYHTMLARKAFRRDKKI